MTIINRKIKTIKKYIPLDWKIRMFILGGYDSTLEDDLTRILWCKDNKIKPYYMRHEKCWASEHRNWYISVASWANQPAIFKKMTFPEFMIKRTGNKVRVSEDTEKYLSVESNIIV